MADPLSIVGSVVGIATLGFKVSLSLFTLAETVGTASDRIESIANDVSSTCGILNQLRNLIKPVNERDGTYITVFNATALSDISLTIHHCESIFNQIEKYLKRATKQLVKATPGLDSKIRLSRTEQAKWPFLQSSFHELRIDLRDSKTNLLLMIAVANLAAAQRRDDGQQTVGREQKEMKATILKLQRAKTSKDKSSEIQSEEVPRTGIKQLFRRVRFWKDGRGNNSGEHVDVGGNGEEEGEETSIVDEGSSHHLPSETTEEDETSLQAVRKSRPASPNREAPQSSGIARPVFAVQQPVKMLGLNSKAENSVDPITSKSSGFVAPSLTSILRQSKPGNSSSPEEHVVENAFNRNMNKGPKTTSSSPAAGHVSIKTSEIPASQNIGPNSTRSGTTSVPHGGSRGESLNRNIKHKNSRRGKDEPGENTPDPSWLPNENNIVGSDNTGFKAKEDQEIIQAWTFTILPGLSSGFGASLRFIELNLSTTEIRTLLQTKETGNLLPLGSLDKLNTYQRHLVLAHAAFIDSKLLYVDVWKKESVPSIFGILEVATLIWITSSAEKKDVPPDIETILGEKGHGSWNTSSTNNLGTESSGTINFKDAVGRRFRFPYPLVKSWNGMEELIKQAFLHVDVIGPHVMAGHYDLVNPAAEIILPQTWESMVQPGWDVTMHMWPMPDAPSKESGRAEPSSPTMPAYGPSPPHTSPPPPPVPPKIKDKRSEGKIQKGNAPSAFMRFMVAGTSGRQRQLHRKNTNPRVDEKKSAGNEDKAVEDLLTKWTLEDGTEAAKNETAASDTGTISEV